MDERIRKRRRTVSREKGRRRATLAFVVFLLVAGVVGFLWLRSTDVFAVKKITATATERVTQEEIAGVTSGALGDSLLSLSTGEVEEALLTLPYVRAAEVYRHFPDTLDVRLEEHQPIARLQAANGTVWLVAENGRVLEKITPPRGAGLPLVIPGGQESPKAGEYVSDVVKPAFPLAVLLQSESIEDQLPPLRQISVSQGGTAILVLKGGSEVRLGEMTELEYKLTVAIEIMQSYLRDGVSLEYVDVAVPERLAVKRK